MKCRIFVILGFLILSLYSSISKAEKAPDFEQTVLLDSLMEQYSMNKNYDSAMLKPTLLAIRFYPELRSTAIEFRYKDIPTLMAARPTFGSLFKRKDNRKYIIIISTNPLNKSKQIFQNMSLASKTGIIGHELAHICVYEELSRPGLLLFGLNYLLNKKRIERNTDKIAISRGLGSEILEYASHIRKSKLASRKYLKRKRKYYLSVAEIQHLVNENMELF